MSKLKVPANFDVTIEMQNKWLEILKKAQDTVEDDVNQQQAAAAGSRLKSRALPPEVVGRAYASYCELVNQMYDAYLNSVHLQRAPYILEIISVIMKRLYELRNELVHIIVNDYVYVDSALQQLKMTPLDIQQYSRILKYVRQWLMYAPRVQLLKSHRNVNFKAFVIVVPYHFPLECRSDNVEKVLQEMWVDALKRKKRRERPVEPKPPPMKKDSNVDHNAEATEEEKDSLSSHGYTSTVQPRQAVLNLEDRPDVLASLQPVVIQRHERYRQWHMSDVREKALQRKQFFLLNTEPAPIELRTKAALLVQMIYREYMKIKRQRVRDYKRDILLGLVSDPFKKGPNFFEENKKVYDRRRNMRLEIKKAYLEELENEKTRLILLRKNDVIEDITDEIRNWFKEWFRGYKFFPQYPFDVEGGTLVVVRGDYPTIDEQKEADEMMINETKGKTKEQIKAEKKQAKKEAAANAEADKLAKKKEKQASIKLRCDPFNDPGYLVQNSVNIQSLIEALQNYRSTWSFYDSLPPEEFGNTIYGFLKPLLIEDLMKEMHFECRKFVDELMRIDLKMLIKLHQRGYAEYKLTYPKVKTRKKPKVQPKPNKILPLNEEFMKSSECVFDLGIVSKPTSKFSDIFGDSNYAAYEYNIKDPDASFPLPGYGDVKGRLMLSCVLGCGIQPGAVRRKAVMLLGPERNGKTFLADTVAGELNAIKIDLSPEVFTAVSLLPRKVLAQAFVVAKAFQPAVIFMKNIERVFSKKTPPEQKYLNASVLKKILGNAVKSIHNEDKIIFIATCSDPWVAHVNPMVSMFDEIILVPRTDYGTLQQFFYQKFQSIRSMPRDYPVQPIAQLCQGFGFADIINIYNEVMTPERIVRLNVEELSPAEIVEKFVENHIEPLTIADYQAYVDFYIDNSELKQERVDYAQINFVRADVYSKAEKKTMKLRK